MKEPKTYKGKLSVILQVATWTADTEDEAESEFLNELIAAIQNRFGDTEGSSILEKYGLKWEG